MVVTRNQLMQHSHIPYHPIRLWTENRLGNPYCPRQSPRSFLHTRHQINVSVFPLIEEVHIPSYPTCSITVFSLAVTEHSQLDF